MAKNANHFLAAVAEHSSAVLPNVEYFSKAAQVRMSSALGMNLMPPTSAFQHGMPSASSESDQDQKPTSKPSDADVLDQEDHQKSNQDNKNNASSSAGEF